MTLLNEIDKWVLELYDKVRTNNIDGVQLIKLIRDEEENKSSVLFYFLVERILKIGLEKNEIIISKGLFKRYLSSSYKEHESYLTYDDIDTEEIEYGFRLRKGIFIKILEELKFNKTKKAYIRYIISQGDGFKKVLSKDELKEFSNLTNVVDILFDEIDLLDYRNMIYNIE